MTYTPKTKVTRQPVEEFLDSVSEQRRDEAYALIDMMKRVSGEEPKMWGPSMIGFGSYHYITKSKCEADWFKIGFSPRKAKISLYLSYDVSQFGDQLEKLGKHTTGKGCLYVSKLEDINMSVLEKISVHAYKSMKDFDASR